jgi:chromosomal replication initiation ATPase DnaA
VPARQAVAWALRQTHPELSLAAIGDPLGDHDYTTIIWALEADERRAKADPQPSFTISPI